jgi:hypothetical protein
MLVVDEKNRTLLKSCQTKFRLRSFFFAPENNTDLYTMRDYYFGTCSFFITMIIAFVEK